MEKANRISIIKQEFKENLKVLSAIGDETRQLILLVLMDNCKAGIQAPEIAKKIKL